MARKGSPPDSLPRHTRGELAMRIWKLTPRDLSDPCWQEWPPDPIVVLAANDSEAHRLAADLAVRRRKRANAVPRHNPPHLNPWALRPSTTHQRPTECEDITD